MEGLAVIFVLVLFALLGFYAFIAVKNPEAFKTMVDADAERKKKLLEAAGKGAASAFSLWMGRRKS
jgi:hypothetical protein